MNLAERVEALTPWAVAGTAAVVAFAGVGWEALEGAPVAWGLLSVQLGVGLAAALAARLLVSRMVADALVQQDALVRRLGELGPDQRLVDPAGLDDELAALARAMNAALEELSEEADGLRADLGTRAEMLEVAPSPLLSVGGDGRIRYANPAARQLFGLREDPIGRRLPEVFRLPELQDAVDAALVGESRDLRGSYGPHDLLVRAYPLAGAALVVLDDVTRFREAERARTDFVANVSHELRTPVAAIAGYAETLLSEPEKLDPEIAPLLETIDRNARRLANLFEDLLRLHRIESRRQELPLEVEPLLPILEEAVVSAADTAAQKGQTFELECPEDLEGLVNAEALSTIVSNLASNAVNYTNASGRVLVRVRPGVIEVIDNGIGIDPVHHDRIFERFYRVDEARSRRAGGTGLGLAIVKHLCMASRCRVTLESAVGRGTIFRVQLPEA